MALLVLLSVAPGDPQPGDSAFLWAIAETPTLVQKCMHVGCYAVLGVLWTWVLAGRYPERRWLIAVVIAILFGAALEALQLLIPGRFGSLVDIGLNSIGAFGGVFVARRAGVGSAVLAPD